MCFGNFLQAEDLLVAMPTLKLETSHTGKMAGNYSLVPLASAVLDVAVGVRSAIPEPAVTVATAVDSDPI
jgi:hypothetical protein